MMYAITTNLAHDRTLPCMVNIYSADNIKILRIFADFIKFSADVSIFGEKLLNSKKIKLVQFQNNIYIDWHVKCFPYYIILYYIELVGGS